MRWIWSGVLMTGLLLVLWGAFEAGQTETSDPIHAYGEDGTPLPMPWPTPKSQS
jgi:hypothetical protein